MSDTLDVIARHTLKDTEFTYVNSFFIPRGWLDYHDTDLTVLNFKGTTGEPGVVTIQTQYPHEIEGALRTVVLHWTRDNLTSTG